MSIKSYKQLLTWQVAKELAKAIYKFTLQFPTEEKFGLQSQMRRSAVSIASNIAEGFGRPYPKEKIHFYSTAKASLYELDCQLAISCEVLELSQSEVKGLESLLERCSRLIQGLINATR